MFEESGAKTIGKSSKSAENEPKKSVFLWKQYSLEELVRFRDEIDACLPPTALKDLNLEELMLLQLHQLRALQTTVLTDETIALNQRAQVANSVANALDKLSQRQEEIWSSERFKGIENLLVRTLTKLPEDLAEQFLNDYERLLDSTAK